MYGGLRSKGWCQTLLSSSESGDGHGTHDISLVFDMIPVHHVCKNVIIDISPRSTRECPSTQYVWLPLTQIRMLLDTWDRRDQVSRVSSPNSSNTTRLTRLAQPESWIFLQQSSYEALGFLVQRLVLWEAELLVHNPHVHLSMIVNPKRSLYSWSLGEL